MVRTKTPARRLALLNAARYLFQETGFERTSMDDIAAHAGSSKATLYRYFVSKESLFQELVAGSAREQGGAMMGLVQRSAGAGDDLELISAAPVAAPMLNPAEPVEPSLYRFGHYILKHFHTPESLGVQRMVIAAAVDPEIGRAYYEQGPARATQYLATYFEAVIGAGALRPADPHVMACHFYGLLESEVHQAGLFNVVTTLDDERIGATVRRALDVFLRAYGAASA
ncbi:TetR/AcrR family transcriptional regulator [Massilia sp. HP4]|uniref:TetR/AcrR family transcriptional regulator n=1 Tax=Massilia sp. HP4 TaxID=2562316 RepID=UPI0010BFC08B|nr:TetR/AcrR family transcriptional regulator [Massilia sp. HP4]